MSRENNILVITHPRSGTHWALDAIRHNSRGISSTFLELDPLLRRDSSAVERFYSALDSTEQTLLIKAHVVPTLEPFRVRDDLSKLVDWLLGVSRILYVYRDGRDVMVSLYYYSMRTQPDVREMSFSEFLRSANSLDVISHLSRVQYWCRHVEGWLDRQVHTATYESFHSDYEGAVRRLAGDLNLQIRPRLRRIDLPSERRNVLTYPRKAVERFITRSKGKSSAANPRKGIVGDWKAHFSQEDLAFFLEHAGDLMHRLGYIEVEETHDL